MHNALISKSSQLCNDDIIFFKTMYNKTDPGFMNNQGHGKY